MRPNRLQEIKKEELFQKNSALPKMLLEHTADELEALGVQCFFCKRIIKKVRSQGILSEGETYHLRVELPILRHLRAR